jgi:hypothetical protein
MNTIRKIQTFCRKTEHLLRPNLQSKLNTVSFGICDLVRHQILSGPKLADKSRLEPFGFKVYSQNDEDGIIQEIFRRIGATSKTFVEFGASDGLENNTIYLLMQGWSGLWIDGDPKQMKKLKQTYARAIARNQLHAECACITKDNINALIGKCYSGEVDLLSIDIDGNDYHVWQNIDCINPRVVIAEYNAKFPPPMVFIMEYSENHWWDGSDKMGMSLQAAANLANEKGYQLVGTNITGTNAFFVRKDIIESAEGESSLFPLPATAENLYNPDREWLKISNGHFAKHFLG